MADVSLIRAERRGSRNVVPPLTAALALRVRFSLAGEFDPVEDSLPGQATAYGARLMSPLVFISYSSKNTGEARAVYDYLNKSLAPKGLRCWIAPDDIVAGMEFGEALVDAINDCRVLVLIFSSHANASPQVRREVERAVSKGKVIIPVRIEDVMPSKAMEFCLGNTHWLDAIASLEAQLDRLASSVHTMLGAIGSLSSIRPAGGREGGKGGEVVKKVAGADARAIEPGTPPVMPGPGGGKAAALLPLTDLDPTARKVVETARLLATRSRSAEITHRLLLAALVAEADGFTSRVCRAGGVDPHLLWTSLTSMSQAGVKGEPKTKVQGQGEETWEEVRLTPAACKRILSPTLERARQLARGAKVTERHLFHAFCGRASSSFLTFLKMAGVDESLELLQTDLAELRAIDPDKPGFLAGLSHRARQVVRQAHILSMTRGINPIPNRLFLAAFLSGEKSVARLGLSQQQAPVATLCDELVCSVQCGAETSFPLEGAASARIIAPVLKRARALAGQNGLVTERLLLQAFCEVCDAGMKAALKSTGVDLDVLAASPKEPSSPKPPGMAKPGPKPKLPFGGAPPDGLN